MLSTSWPVRHQYKRSYKEEIVRNAHDELQYCSSTKTLLHHVWKETLRLHPPTPNQTRRVTTKDNALFPYGSKVVVIWGLFHLDPQVWGPDVIQFNPNRWLDVTREQEQHYNPFGTGVRKCVAMNYASFGGRVMLKRIVESKIVKHWDKDSTTDGIGTDRGYSRGPDPDASVLRFISRMQVRGVPEHGDVTRGSVIARSPAA